MRMIKWKKRYIEDNAEKRDTSKKEIDMRRKR